MYGYDADSDGNSSVGYFDDRCSGGYGGRGGDGGSRRGVIGVNPGVLGGGDPQILGWRSWGLYEILLHHVMYRNIFR